MNFFTSDWHLNEKRITPAFNPFFRPFLSIEEQNEIIINNVNAMVGENDTLYHLGDVAMDLAGVALMDRIKCQNRVLIIGNYDDDKIDALKEHIDIVVPRLEVEINGQIYHLNHYPTKIKPRMMNIVGHIHGLWKVQPSTINVGVDAWNYKPLTEADIKFVTTAIEKFYDNDVFPLVEADDLAAYKLLMATEEYKRPTNYEINP